KFVADQINQQREGHDITRERDPGEHWTIDFFEPVAVQRADDNEVDDKQDEEPFDGQFVDLPRIDHSAEYCVSALTGWVLMHIPVAWNVRQSGPEGRHVSPLRKWFALGTEEKNGDPSATSGGGDDQRRRIAVLIGIRDEYLAVAELSDGNLQRSGFKL